VPLGILRLNFHRVTRSIWFTPAAYAVATLAVLLAAPLLEPLVPRDLERLVSLDAVRGILEILASSLLAVAIFSLGTMVAALQATTSSATPRARPLIAEDAAARNAISTFIGGFIFAVLALVGFSTGYYNGPGRVILMAGTLVVILLVIGTLISWIGRISQLGGVQEAINLVASNARRTFDAYAADPAFGGRVAAGPPEGAHPVHLDRAGFIQLVDGRALAGVAERLETDLYLVARPGAHIGPGRPVLYAGALLDAEARREVDRAVVIADERTFEQDPRFGLIVLSEIASRALSPAVNDPGTAIAVLLTQVRVLVGWRDAADGVEPEVRHPRLHVVPVGVEDLLADAFRWIARDGAHMLEVQIKLQKSLAGLAARDPATFAAPARALAAEALDRAERALEHAGDREALREVAAWRRRGAAP
jgi:uncharacterized membrane protein